VLWNNVPAGRSPLLAAISEAYLRPEADAVTRVLAPPPLSHEQRLRVHSRAAQLVRAVRSKGRQSGGLEAFLQEYDLASQEGVILMCLAEALLRIPDDHTADLLIQDKLSKADWSAHLGHSHSLFVNASTWSLLLTGRLVEVEREARERPQAWFKRFVARVGESVVRAAMRQAMRIMGQQFVMGETIGAALARSREETNARYRYSFDMLGEAALTRADADGYFRAYSDAIKALACADGAHAEAIAGPSLSIKLSALHPRYHPWQWERVHGELAAQLLALAQQAREAGIFVTWDAEESERLALSLELFEQVSLHPSLKGWDGLGLAVQAYQKRAPAVLEWLHDLAVRGARCIPLRLVKGAYWDSEIKRAQEQGWPDYPVYTRKHHTDSAYIACAARLLRSDGRFYPQFATHNAHTVAVILELAQANSHFEFQRLHGMGESLYEEIVGEDKLNVPCRVYAPVGGHRELLPYLVRRLLENGANTSFVNRLVDEEIPVEDIIADPLAAAQRTARQAHPRIPLPENLYGEARRNSTGLNLFDDATLRQLDQALSDALARQWVATSVVDGKPLRGSHATPVLDPSDRRRQVGIAYLADAQALQAALAAAAAGAPRWEATAADTRAGHLERAADLLEQHRHELMALLIREAGRSVVDAQAEVREAADFCRYYATLARRQFGEPQRLTGYTGESNELWLRGRGVFACISPWNFPLAIFTGQVAAALAAGNAVIAKPALQTPLIATRAVQLLHEAGIPGSALHLLLGQGDTLGKGLTTDPRIAGIAFTGSTTTARAINAALAGRDGPIIPFIAETGGQNAMIVDSSALIDQVILDVLQSAFNSAGQRCSALRVLFLQQDIAPRALQLLQGALAELRVGDPGRLCNDVGPVIDTAAREKLERHVQTLQQHARCIARAPLSAQCAHGNFFAPQAWALDDIARLQGEVFGPVLHVITYGAGQLDAVLDAIHGTGFGLTLGLHSRIEATADYVRQRAKVGNLYVNRNMIGAVVGVQPFGGENNSGTGPKAGGPHYLLRFAQERTVTVNTAAAGGNTTLLSLDSSA
jgi:RHH-type proline utilization regulon transcriptional repressor/proline dehydrogenase/delta 1-pyrroline-5-carboxylate dehydrogenase